jgi:hypothetical protein
MPSGALASVHYGWEETAFKTKSAAVNKTFGVGSKISDLTRNNNLEIIYGLGDREAAVNLEKQFQGSFSVDSYLSDPWIFKAYFGDVFSTVEGTVGVATTTLSSDALLGATTLSVASETGFTAGNVVKLAGATANTYEIRKVVSNSAGKVVVDKPLNYLHVSGLTLQEIGGTGGTNYYHVFRNLNTPSLNTLTIQNTIDLGANPDVQTNLLGSIPVGASISTSVGSPVTTSYEFIYGQEDPEDSPAFVAQTQSTFRPYSFAYGNLYTPGSRSSALTAVQSCDISITPTEDLIYGLGDRGAQTYVEMQYDYSITSEMYFQNKNDYLALFMDGTSTYPVTNPVGGRSVAENGLVLHMNDGTNNMVFSFGGVKADSTSMPQDPTAPIMESVTLKARTLHVYAYNATAAIP